VPPVVSPAPLTDTRFVLPRAATMLATSSNGGLVAAGSDDLFGIGPTFPFVVWDDTGKERFRATEEAAIRAAAFDARGTLLVTAHEGAIDVLDTNTWKSRATFAICDRITAIALAPDDKTIAVGCETGVQLIPIEGGKPTAIANDDTHHLAWSHDGRWLATSDGARSIRVIDTLTRAIARTIETTAYHAMAFAPDAPILAYADFSTTELVDAATGATQPTIEIAAGALAFSRDGKRLAIATINGPPAVLVVDLATRATRDVLGPARKGSAQVHFDDRDRLWIAQDHGVRAFDGTSLRELVGPRGHRGAVTQLAYRKDGALLASGSSDRTVRVWDLATGTSKIIEVVTRSRDEAMNAITGLAFAGDGSLLVTDEYDYREWTPDAFALRTARHLQRDLGGVVELPDGSIVILGIDDESVTLRWIDRSGRELRRAEVETTSRWPRMHLVRSADGKRLAVASPSVQILDAMTGKQLATDFDSDVRGIALDGAGTLLGVAGGGDVLQIKRLGGTDPEAHVAFAPTAIAIRADGKRAIVGGRDGQVAIVDLTAATDPIIHEGRHVGPVRSIAIAPDGTSFATGGQDGSIVRWPLP
jgi:WD40 repeat protein